ncbi:hypothetical protein T4D_3187 [Trichinella pseudospiralis]|uniref:Uncharacterized protein n=1 Tax=Trichinella pseudospiralis TaxID=6337 RepID=A0A0V1FKB8_TRIPS|nr:hypothetical protein T4D_3187 [Trichinella pseudospiralis]
MQEEGRNALDIQIYTWIIKFQKHILHTFDGKKFIISFMLSVLLTIGWVPVSHICKSGGNKGKAALNGRSERRACQAMT